MNSKQSSLGSKVFTPPRAVSPFLAHNLIGGSSHDWSLDNNAVCGAGALTYPGVTQNVTPSRVRGADLHTTRSSQMLYGLGLAGPSP